MPHDGVCQLLVGTGTHFLLVVLDRAVLAVPVHREDTVLSGAQRAELRQLCGLGAPANMS